MNVVLSFIHYPLAMGRYFEAALRRRKDVNLFTVGPDTGKWIPWNNGIYLESKTKFRSPDFITSTSHSIPPFASLPFIESKIPFKPDLWLQVDAGFYLEGHPKNGVNAIVGTDPHVLNYDRQRTFADIFYCMQDFYKKKGDKYLPYAYDPIWHAVEDVPRKYDVSFVGLHYANRIRLFKTLKARGITVHHANGPVYEEARHFINEAPISINWASLSDLTARVFELLGMQRLAIVNNVPDLPKFFTPGKDLVTFDSFEEAIEKVEYYLSHPDEAELIAEQGHKTVKPHTWDARIEQILSDL